VAQGDEEEGQEQEEGAARARGSLPLAHHMVWRCWLLLARLDVGAVIAAVASSLARLCL